MRCLILAALIAFCAGSIVPNGYRIVFNDDENVVLHGLTGNKFMFTNFPGQQYMDIMINGADTPMKKIRINGQTCQIMNLEGFGNLQNQMVKDLPMQMMKQDMYSQGMLLNNYLFKILRSYEGMLDEYQFNHLLNVIQTEVKEGKLCYVIYELMSYLDKVINVDMVQKYLMREQMVQNQMPVTGLGLYQNQMMGGMGDMNMGSLYWLRNIMANKQMGVMNRMGLMNDMGINSQMGLMNDMGINNQMGLMNQIEMMNKMDVMKKMGFMNQMDEMNQMSMMNKMDYLKRMEMMNQMNQMYRMNPYMVDNLMVQQPLSLYGLGLDNQMFNNNMYGNSRMMDYMMMMRMMMMMGKQNQGGLYYPYNQRMMMNNYVPMVYRY